MNNQIEPKTRSWYVFFIGLLLLLLGGLIFISTVPPLIYDGFRMQFWNTTQANLLTVELEIHYTSHTVSLKK